MNFWPNFTHLKQWFTPPTTKIPLGSGSLFGMFPVSMIPQDFSTHLYVVGASGQGKSKFLQHLLFELTTKGHGCGLFDPHADLVSDLLGQLASYPVAAPWLAQRPHYERIIYLDPSRTDYLVPCNILKSSFSSPYEIAENVVEAFRRVWPETLAEAPRFAQIMRNALLVLITCGLSLLELEPLLTDAVFRKRMLTAVKDPLVVSFFTHQFDRWGREQPIFVAPVLNKVSAFLFKPQVRLMLGANDNQLDFRSIIDGKKILMINLGCFRDEETQRLLGSLFLTSLEQAAFSRSNQAKAERQPFFCMIDEFPLFCARDSTALARILSECRKYRLHLGLAHQTITQLPTERLQGALENAKLKVVFGTGRQTAEAIVKDLFMPNPKSIKHEISDEAAKDRTHPLFNPLGDQFEIFTQTIQRLRQRKVLVRLPDQEKVHKVRVPKVPSSRISALQLERVKQALAKAVGTPYATLEQQIMQRAKQYGVPLYIQTPERVEIEEQVWQ